MIWEIGPKEQEGSVGKREGDKEGVPASVLGGQGFHHGRLPARTPGVGSRVGKQMPPLTQDGQMGWTPLLS